MLNLDRRPGESIIIDHDIKITILDIKGDNVSIRIDAPEDVLIIREELAQIKIRK